MASSSKPVTATLVMILVDQGKLSLDDPIEKYLPEFKGITIKGKPPAQAADGSAPSLQYVGIARRFPRRVDAQATAEGSRQSSEDAKDGRPKRGTPRARFFSSRNRSLSRVGARAWPKGAWRPSPARSFTIAPWVSTWRPGWPKWRPNGRSRSWSAPSCFEPMGMKNTRYTPFGLQGTQVQPDAPERREPVHHGRRRHDLDPRRLRRVLPDALKRRNISRAPYSLRASRRDDAHASGQARITHGRPYGKDYGLAFFLDRLDDNGQARVITHPGLFGTTPWLDKDRELVGVFFVQSNFLRTMSLVALRSRTKVRAATDPVRLRTT